MTSANLTYSKPVQGDFIEQQKRVIFVVFLTDSVFPLCLCRANRCECELCTAALPDLRPLSAPLVRVGVFLAFPKQSKSTGNTSLAHIQAGKPVKGLLTSAHCLDKPRISMSSFILAAGVKRC